MDEIAQAHALRRLLWLNAGLDLLYLALGWRLAQAAIGSARRGHGLGILAQGGFLLLFDLLHARAVPQFAAPSLPPAPQATPMPAEAHA